MLSTTVWGQKEESKDGRAGRNDQRRNRLCLLQQHQPIPAPQPPTTTAMARTSGPCSTRAKLIALTAVAAVALAVYVYHWMQSFWDLGNVYGAHLASASRTGRCLARARARVCVCVCVCVCARTRRAAPTCATDDDARFVVLGARCAAHVLAGSCSRPAPSSLARAAACRYVSRTPRAPALLRCAPRPGPARRPAAGAEEARRGRRRHRTQARARTNQSSCYGRGQPRWRGCALTPTHHDPCPPNQPAAAAAAAAAACRRPWTPSL